MQGAMHELGNRKSKEGNKLGSLGEQTNFTNFPILPANCCEFIVCLEKQEKRELVSCPRKSHRSQLWVEKGWGRSGQGCVCCLLSVTS